MQNLDVLRLSLLQFKSRAESNARRRFPIWLQDPLDLDTLRIELLPSAEQPSRIVGAHLERIAVHEPIEIGTNLSRILELENADLRLWNFREQGFEFDRHMRRDFRYGPHAIHEGQLSIGHNQAFPKLTTQISFPRICFGIPIGVFVARISAAI